MPTARPLQLGFIGGSAQSAVGPVHFAACRLDGLFDVAAGCFSRDSATNAATAARYGVAPERTYDDRVTMLAAEKGRLDAIVVLTPTPDHADAVTACLRAGHPVICEKALAASRAEIRGIQAEQQAAGSPVAVAYNYAGYPLLRELRHRISAGALGCPRQIQLEMPQDAFVRRDASGRPVPPQTWRLWDGPVPNVYLDLGVHLHHMAYFLLGEHPEATVAMAATHGHFAVVDTVSALVRFPGGAQGSLWFTKAAAGQRNGLRVRVYGDEGGAEWLQTDPESLILSTAAGQRHIIDRGSDAPVASASRYQRFKAGHPAGFLEAFANLYADLHGWLSGDGREAPEIAGPAVARPGLAFLEAMVESSRTTAWTLVADTDEDRATRR